LRSACCDMVLNERAAAAVTDLPTTARKADIYLCAFKILTILLAHRGVFSRQHQDEILSAFQVGLHRWPSTAKHCILALTIALHELPQSMIKLLPAILLKVSQTMSSAMAVHNLEFLAALATCPQLYVNFTEADFKRLFGVALQHIQPSSRSSGVSPAPATGMAGGPPPSAIPPYVVQLAYQVLASWFLRLRLPERRKYVSFIVHYLLLSGTGRALDENVELVLDMLMLNSFADCWPRPPEGVARLQNAAKTPSRTWVQGSSLLTVRVLRQAGWSEVVVRRPSGTVTMWVRLENPLKSVEPRTRSMSMSSIFGVDMPIGLDSAGAPSSERLPPAPSLAPPIPSFRREDPQALDPSFVLSQFVAYPDLSLRDPPRPLPDDDATTRALSVLDRTPAVDLHKIGVVYVGPSQRTESEILSNTHGSTFYTLFLRAVGRMVRLKDCREVYTGGLDTSDDLDGKAAIYALTELAQVVFHCTTLMPTSAHDPLGTAKKRHIGNDFVTLVWNESGGAYGFDTIPAQFNFVHIVVEP
ncbi:hypothetical protein BDK51DRAFT_14615, partial [Blyttiomyces helicus]